MEASKAATPNLPTKFYEVMSSSPDLPIRLSTLFMKRFGDGLGETVILTAGGTEWKVWLKHINGGTWFEKGWRGFVDFYSIKEDYLVNFRYQGDSRFLVIIFDETSNEIAYPGDSRLQVAPVKAEPDEAEAEVAPDAGDNGGAVKTGGGVTVVNGRRLRKRAASRVSDSKAPAPADESLDPDDVQQKIMAVEREFVSKTENPFVVCVMKPTYVATPYAAGLPLKFLRAYFAETELRQGATLDLSLAGEKKKWSVNLRVYGSNATVRGAGWKHFVEAKELKVGQTVIFELIKKEMVLILHKID